MTGTSFATAVGSWPKRDEEAFQRGNQVPTKVLASLLGACKQVCLSYGGVEVGWPGSCFPTESAVCSVRVCLLTRASDAHVCAQNVAQTRSGTSCRQPLLPCPTVVLGIAARFPATSSNRLTSHASCALCVAAAAISGHGRFSLTPKV